MSNRNRVTVTYEAIDEEGGRTWMKKIGLVGGMTPESTTSYYQMIINLGRQIWDDPLHNPVVLIYSIDLAEIVAHQDVGDEDRVVEILADALEKLRGAEVGALTANTPHIFFGRIQARTTLPLVNIVDATVQTARDLGVRRALLLGTNSTMEGSMYPEAFAAGGIEIVIPDEGERRFINRSIYEDLAVGRVTPELREAFIAICRRHIEGNNADAVILGCTEVPLVLAADDLPVPLVDTARCHADAIFEQARN
jgi:aspartate racemase